MRLETQLAAIDRGQGDPNAEQVKRYEEAASKQQAELDRLVAQSRQLGCQRSSFFLFGGGQPPQCDSLTAQIQRMRANLDRMIAGLQQLQGGDRDEQRRTIMIALAQNQCGPQYRIATPTRPGGFFDTLFGGPAGGAAVPYPDMTQTGTYRTLCVRTCDGFFFPISYSTGPGKFRDDERACQRMCPAAEVALYTHRNPGEEVAAAVSLSGRPYSEHPNAFRYRQEYNAACGCKKPGESWAAAVGEDTTVERGDVVVTEETAKALLQPKPEPPAKPARQQPPRNRAGTAAAPPASDPPPQARPAAPRSAAAPDTGAQAAPGEPPRAIGPQFISPR